MATLRTFVAVPVTAADVVERLVEAQRGLGVGRDVKWTAPHQLHFTLKFLGELPAERVEDAKRAVHAAASAVPPFTLALAGLGTFPPRREARVVWAGCGEGREELEGLAAAVEAAFVAAGLPAEERRFTAHLTLGRVRERGAGRSVARAVEGCGAGTLGTVAVDSMVFYRSELGSAGAVHTPLLIAPLAG